MAERGSARVVTVAAVALPLSVGLAGLFFSRADPLAAVRAVGLLMTSSSRLTSDYLALASPGTVLLNASLVGLWAVLLAWGSGVMAHRPAVALTGVFLATGFGAFGMNSFNVWPSAVGVWLFARLTRTPLHEQAAPLLFGCTLAPIVSEFAFDLGLGVAGWMVGPLVGVVAGFFVAALAGHVYTMHQGYNLYNVGTTAGLIGVVVTMLMKGFGYVPQPMRLWSDGVDGALLGTLVVLLTGWLAAGLAVAARDGRDTMAALRAIWASTGRLPSDFIALGGLGPTMVNMAAMGVLGLSYVLAVGGPVNGPVFAGVLALMGFGAFGKHPRNAAPVMLGVFLACIPKIWSPSDPGPLLAALFCTTLAPFCGRFGFWAGLLAGALHLPMVMHVPELHGYLVLFNNGFGGGLAMLILVGVLKGVAPRLLEEPGAAPPPPPPVGTPSR